MPRALIEQDIGQQAELDAMLDIYKLTTWSFFSSCWPCDGWLTNKDGVPRRQNPQSNRRYGI
jgi:hypothetical protein